jgi:hypothetical protein
MSDGDFEHSGTVKTAYRKSNFSIVILSRIGESMKSKIDVTGSV